MYNQERVRRINIVARYKQCILKASIKSELPCLRRKALKCSRTELSGCSNTQGQHKWGCYKSIYYTRSRFPSGAAHRWQIKFKLRNISPTRWQCFHPVRSTEPIVSHAPRVMAAEENSLTTVVQVCGCAPVHVFLLHMHVEALMRAGKLCTCLCPHDYICSSTPPC